MSDDVVWMEQKRVMQNCFKLDSSPSQTGMNFILFPFWLKDLSRYLKVKLGKLLKMEYLREQNFIRMFMAHYQPVSKDY